MGTSCSLGGLQRTLSINTSVILHPVPHGNRRQKVTLPFAGTAVCFQTPEQLKQQDKVPKTKHHFHSTLCATPQHVQELITSLGSAAWLRGRGSGSARAHRGNSL